MPYSDCGSSINLLATEVDSDGMLPSLDNTSQSKEWKEDSDIFVLRLSDTTEVEDSCDMLLPLNKAVEEED